MGVRLLLCLCGARAVLDVQPLSRMDKQCAQPDFGAPYRFLGGDGQDAAETIMLAA